MPELKTADLRRQARMAVLQSLFALDIKDVDGHSCLDWLAQENSLSDKAADFANLIFDGVCGRRPALDEVTHRYAPAWPVSQLASVDRNILRIALFELLHYPETPRKTAINEAVELAKTFGSESSAKFVNGVLGSVMSGLETGELTADGVAPEGG